MLSLCWHGRSQAQSNAGHPETVLVALFLIQRQRGGLVVVLFNPMDNQF